MCGVECIHLGRNVIVEPNKFTFTLNDRDCCGVLHRGREYFVAGWKGLEPVIISTEGLR